MLSQPTWTGVLFSLALSALLAACASKGMAVNEPCQRMQAQIKEKQDLDARIKSLTKQAGTYRKKGDTASAASAEHRLRGMLENQRLLKESLDQSGNDCRSIQGDPLPVRGPAAQDPERMK
jgi:hypothetical protein